MNSNLYPTPSFPSNPSSALSFSNRLSPHETAVLLAVLGLALVAVLISAIHGPIVQAQHFHAFADSRTWAGIPHAADVLSNLGFLVMGLMGLHATAKARLSPAACMGATTFFAGLLITCVGSSMYHWSPMDSGLAIDRFAISIAFAAVLGWLASVQVSERAGLALLGSMLVMSPTTVAIWSFTGDLGPYVVMQFGGMALALGLAFAAPQMRKATLALLAFYALAKVFEVLDHEILDATGHLISGHSLKHIAAALAATPLIAVLRCAAHK